MKRNFSKIICVILIIFTALCFLTISASSAGFQSKNHPYVYVSCGNYSRVFSVMNYGYNMNRTLSQALVIAGNKATDSRKAYVYVSKGKYEIDDTLLVYSNTVLLANDAVFTGNGNILRNGFDGKLDTATRYNGAKNITIMGGKWNMNVLYELATSTDTRHTHSTFRFAHCKSIEIKNCTFKNNYNAHDIELGGVYKVKIENCKFINDKSVNKFGKVFGKEAVQFDVNTEKSMPHIPEYDYTASEEITVRGCLFENKFSGIGSHHGVIGNPYMNIHITNNTFKNIACFGISGSYWYNVDIGNNDFIDVGSGIDLRSVSKPSSKSIINYFDYGYEDILKTINNSQAFIYGNEITVREKENYFKIPFGIKVSGSKYTKKNLETNIPQGAYYFYSLFMNNSPKWQYITNTVTGTPDNNIITNIVKQ